jgi:hypothetical protein
MRKNLLVKNTKKCGVTSFFKYEEFIRYISVPFDLCSKQ